MHEDIRLTPHFKLSEFTKSATAARMGIENTPNDEAVRNLRRLCEKVLEPLREHIGKPLLINSGYRCPKLNAAIKGASPRSLHQQGRAADLARNPEWYRYIRDHLPHTELLYEGTHIHVAL